MTDFTSLTRGELTALLDSGGKLLTRGGRLFVVQQTGLILGPIQVEQQTHVLLQGLNRSISMPGENFRDKLQVSSDGADLHVDSVNVDNRSQVTLSLRLDAAAVANSMDGLGGRSLTYETREGADGSSVTIQNNVLALPNAPSIASAAISQHEVGDGDALYADAAKGVTLTGSNFYDLSQMPLQGGADLAALGLGEVSARVRIGQATLDGGGALTDWADDDEFTISGLSVDSLGQISLSVSIDGDKLVSNDPSVDTVSFDMIVETYSGDLSDDSLSGNTHFGAASIAHAMGRGQAALIEDAIVIRRAEPHRVLAIFEFDSAGYDAADPETAKGLQVDDASFIFRQHQSRDFVAELESVFSDAGAFPGAGGRHCADTSLTMAFSGPGAIHASAGYSVGAADPKNAIELLSPTLAKFRIECLESQPIGDYVLTAQTTSSNAAMPAGRGFIVHVSQAVLQVTAITITDITPDSLEADGGAVQMVIDGDGFTEAAGEGSMVVSAINAESKSLVFSGLNVGSDDQLTVDVELQIATLAAAGAADVEDYLGNYDVSVQLTDALGNVQSVTEAAAMRVLYPDIEFSSAPDNMCREDSRAAGQSDTMSVKLLHARGSHDAAAPAVNGISAFTEYQEHEWEIRTSGGVCISTQDAAQLASNGGDRLILITAIRAAKSGENATNSLAYDVPVYEWEFDVELVSEADMQAAGYNGLEDFHVEYGGSKLSLAVRNASSDDGADADAEGDWLVMANWAEIMPANVEIDQATFQIEQGESALATGEATAVQSGDNLYPLGAGDGTGAAAGGGAIADGSYSSTDGKLTVALAAGDITVSGSDMGDLNSSNETADGDDYTFQVMIFGAASNPLTAAGFGPAFNGSETWRVSTTQPGSGNVLELSDAGGVKIYWTQD